MPHMTGKERRYLRALAHRLSPVVAVGQRGLSEAVLQQIDGALTDHELIKIRIGAECPVGRDAAAAAVAAHTGSEVAGVIGRVLIVYRPHPERPMIVFSDAAPSTPEHGSMG